MTEIPLPSEKQKKKDLCPGAACPYLNRELSWIDFNRRVLAEATDPNNPLLERVTFLGIVADNLDEFFMVRVAGLAKEIRLNKPDIGPDGMHPLDQVRAIRDELYPLYRKMADCWHTELLVALEEAGIPVKGWNELSSDEQAGFGAFFEESIRPKIAIIPIGRKSSFPPFSELCENIVVMMRGGRSSGVILCLSGGEERLSRFIPVPSGGLILVEEVVRHHAAFLFPDDEVTGTYLFRVTRDSDLELKGDDDTDLTVAIIEGAELLQTRQPVRLEVEERMPFHLTTEISTMLGLIPDLVFTQKPPLGLADLKKIPFDRPDLRYLSYTPTLPPGFTDESTIFSSIRRHDRLLFTPYDSFEAFVLFLRAAADDPSVLSIRTTLYRVGPHSPVIDTLILAKKNGKQVEVVVELKASFDEEANFRWATLLKEAGVLVTHGAVGLKVHAKCAFVSRKEEGGVVRYSFLSTGNFNLSTSRIYSDLAIFTADAAIGSDLVNLFNILTGYTLKAEFTDLLVTPVISLRDDLIRRIEEERNYQKRSGNGRIIMKVNSLSDRKIIDALRKASEDGVQVDLIIRGINCIRSCPGSPKTRSVVGRFLEHARVFYFSAGGRKDLYFGSADLMPRNLNRRVEVIFPIKDPWIKEIVLSDLLPGYLKDSKGSWKFLPDGRSEPVVGDAISCQEQFLRTRGFWHREEKGISLSDTTSQ
ncbi:MAG: polyphosphate kinase 1 [Methanocalculus sp.]|uniref:polyphosphate kinase 1 n=1 Tax=Methanocalculus sp. TaxID=2004547 RepID=UPI002727873A|nr:polyphosphate kinase 1 [Methanocalculus sp.]MDO9540303.1 polyphosphate kinase 1 [Methanocalculus sp.]